MSSQSSPPGLSEWLTWPTQRVAEWISARHEPVVVGWPFNGTRRWYVSYKKQNPEAQGYLPVLIRRRAELHRCLFSHGVGVILEPGFNYETLKRGSSYARYVLSGLMQQANDSIYQEMYAAGLRVRFYGDYAEVLNTPELRPILEACRELTNATTSGEGPLLLIGLFADAPYPAIARLSVELARESGHVPTRRELIEAYYGVEIPDLSLFIGFNRPELFDVPLLTTGEESIYATLNASPDVTQNQLREILYDHLVNRKAPSVDYDALPAEGQAELDRRNERHAGVTLGVGRINPLTGKWEPLLPGLDDPISNR